MDLSVTELHDLLKSKKIKPIDLVNEALEKIENYKCIFDAEDMDVYEYLKALRTLVKDGTSKFLDESELKSDVDSILSLIDSTLYKLKELSENKSKSTLKDFLIESLNR